MQHYLRDLIEQYGYYALFVGTLCEGETILLLGGMAARAGHLLLPWVMVIAFCGSLLGDQIVFFIGRIYGKAFLARRPRLQPRVAKVHRLMERHHVLLLIGFRFLYGLRNIIPLVIATSEVKVWRFVVLNVIGAALWAVTVAFLGFFLGAAVESLMGRVKIIALIAVAVLALLVWVVRHLYLRHKARRAPPPVPEPPPREAGENE
jgi:membrane protein DedA with SNARE-associated domain